MFSTIYSYKLFWGQKKPKIMKKWKIVLLTWHFQSSTVGMFCAFLSIHQLYLVKNYLYLEKIFNALFSYKLFWAQKWPKSWKNGNFLVKLTFSIERCGLILSTFSNPSTLLGTKLPIFKKLFCPLYCELPFWGRKWPKTMKNTKFWKKVKNLRTPQNPPFSIFFGSDNFFGP